MDLRMKIVYGIMINNAIDGRIYTKRKLAIEKCKRVYEVNPFIHNYIQEIYAEEQNSYASFDAWFKDFVINGNEVLEICNFEVIEGD